MLGSLGLFLRYLVRNLGVNQGDEAYYVIVADRILKGGLFGFREELRTYLYPLLLSFAQVLFGKSPVCKAFVGPSSMRSSCIRSGSSPPRLSS
jgi:hypothetical protein